MFPDSNRVTYKKSPLSHVECELEFNPILSIDTEIPVLFQKKLRTKFPRYAEVKPDANEFGSDLPVEIVNFLSKVQPKLHRFNTEDFKNAIFLTKNSLSLMDYDYLSREQFLDTFRQVESCFKSIYKPLPYLKITISYVNEIVRSKVGLKGVCWKELLSPELLGMLACQDSLASCVLQTRTQVELSLKGLFAKRSESRCRIRHGLAVPGTGDAKEDVYYLECQFSHEFKKGDANVFKFIEVFAEQSGRLFRSFVTERLHTAFEPVDVSQN